MTDELMHVGPISDNELLLRHGNARTNYTVSQKEDTKHFFICLRQMLNEF